MIGRALVRVPVRSRLIRPLYQCQHGQVGRAPAVLPLRTYATPGRPKSVVGEPSKPVKRAVKKAAAKPPTGDSPAEKAVKANKRNAAKKTAGTKKKELTPTQKERAEKRKLKEEERLAKEKARKTKLRATTKASAEKDAIKQLKKTALKPPQLRRAASYVLFHTENLKNHDLSSGSAQDRREALARAARDSSAKWKDLSPAEREHYNHLANTKNEECQAEYKKWVESHSADEIQQANSARGTLRRKLEKDRPRNAQSKWLPIHDERAVKRPVPPYTQFTMNRNASGDFKGIALAERSKLISQEWKALSEQEKSKYQRLGTQEAERYATEYKEVYGHEQPQAAAAAA
ncbi:hypothetical protein PRZ48_000415 [Zasmidium cellare]|uniref:HMG box domain-containing protein n=1 Tax=Zasmidium cellare TaxID=395010 RepID=A0ABR0EYF5_ZASCE|nr:hypothetical protein PRZ48_000415 [Zasmidium cellare]